MSAAKSASVPNNGKAVLFKRLHLDDLRVAFRVIVGEEGTDCFLIRDGE